MFPNKLQPIKSPDNKSIIKIILGLKQELAQMPNPLLSSTKQRLSDTACSSSDTA